jgi:hypothetical protein
VHWSGVVRIIEFIVSTLVCFAVRYWLHQSWWVALGATALSVIFLPVLIGLAWGIIERGRFDRALQKIAREQMTARKP